MDTIALPKRTREGSFTDEQITEALATLDAAPDGEAVVVGRDFESENTARNRARLMATALEAKTERFYSAHAVKDQATWIAAVSERANQAPRAPLPERDPNAPSMRDLQAAARYLDIKGRSKLDYDALSAAVQDADEDTPLDDWKGYARTVADAANDD